MSDDNVRYSGDQVSSYEITGDHIKELASLYGDNVLVVQPETASLWVIGTGNQHYDGAHTVYATSRQVANIVKDDYYDTDGQLTDWAAWHIAEVLTRAGQTFAVESALKMTYPEGYTARVMREMEDN
jgi:hypothetical protein